MPHDEHTTEQAQTPTGPQYWRSLDELSDTPAFKEWLHREFPQGAAEAEGVNRRHFIKIMAASFALGGLGMAGCRRPETHIRPYGKQPERIMPGVEVHYASSIPGSRENIPLVVETHQNRPIKLEGNARFAPYGGATDTSAQASILDLYDPDRATAHYRGTARLSAAQVNDLLAGIGKRFGGNGGQGLAFLAQPGTSATRARLVAQLRSAMPQAIWAEYEPVDRGNWDRAASELFGVPTRPVYDFAAAKRILSLDSDFVATEPGHLGNARAFAAGRKVFTADEAGKMNRLYVAESVFSLTGAMADHRLRVPSSQIPALAALVLAEVLEQTGGDAGLAATLRQRAQGVEADPAWVHECVRDLVASSGAALVLAGSHHPIEVQAIAAYINELLGATGRTPRRSASSPRPSSRVEWRPSSSWAATRLTTPRATSTGRPCRSAWPTSSASATTSTRPRSPPSRTAATSSCRPTTWKAGTMAAPTTARSCRCSPRCSPSSTA